MLFRSDNLVAMRRQEDRAAVDRLGAEVVWLDFQDAVYRGRTGKDGWYYTSIAEIFGSIHPDESALSEAIAAAVCQEAPFGSQTTLYAPLTVEGMSIINMRIGPPGGCGSWGGVSVFTKIILMPTPRIVFLLASKTWLRSTLR